MSLSRFLPADYDPEAPVAILAGRGAYPHLMADRMLKTGIPTRLIAVADETDPELVNRFPEAHRRVLRVGQIGRLLKALQEMSCRYNVMVGQIRPGRLFKGIHPDVKAIRILNSLKERNAETIYGAIVAEMNSIGVSTLDARVFIDDQLATPGVMTGGKPKVSESTLEHGIRMANAVAGLDIGQGVVVKKGTVLCVEEFDGTDSMLKRAARFDTKGKLFVKTVKPNQNFAIDVPVFGERTLDSMKEGGVQVAALAVDKTIMIHKDQVLEKARKYKIQIIGFEENSN